jgi:uncharacterized protein YjiS (DUF1127 family)
MTQHILTLNNYLRSPIEGLVEAFRSYRKRSEYNAHVRATIKELRKLSDRELNDIGISRGDIIAVAYGDETLKRGDSWYKDL